MLGVYICCNMTYMRLGEVPCRFVFILDGLLALSGGAAGTSRALHAGEYAYMPPDSHILCAAQLMRSILCQSL